MQRAGLGHTSSWALPQCHVSRLWWITPVIPALGRWRPERQELKVSLGYVLKGVSPLLPYRSWGWNSAADAWQQAPYSLSHFACPVLTFLEPLLCLVG